MFYTGTGVQGSDRRGGNRGIHQSISSPWDLCIYKIPQPEEADNVKEVLLIAMAGTHQIWALFLADTIWWKKHFTAGTCSYIAGSGREENRNNQYPHAAAFAQPSGLALHVGRNEVYIADSESSTIRKLSLIDGKVSAVVGGSINPSVSIVEHNYVEVGRHILDHQSEYLCCHFHVNGSLIPKNSIFCSMFVIPLYIISHHNSGTRDQYFSFPSPKERIAYKSFCQY